MHRIIQYHESHFECLMSCTLKSPFETLFAWQDDDASGFGKSGFLSWKSEEQCGGGSGFLPKLAVSSL